MPNYDDRRPEAGSNFGGKNPTLAHPMYLIFIGDKQVGRMMSLDGDEDYGIQPVPEVGEPGPLEYVQTDYRVTVRIGHARILTKAIHELGMRIRREDIVRSGYLTIKVVDKLLGKTIETFQGCKLARGTVRYAPNAIVITDATFNCIRHTEPDEKAFDLSTIQAATV